MLAPTRRSRATIRREHCPEGFPAQAVATMATSGKSSRVRKVESPFHGKRAGRILWRPRSRALSGRPLTSDRRWGSRLSPTLVGTKLAVVAPARRHVEREEGRSAGDLPWQWKVSPAERAGLLLLLAAVPAGSDGTIRPARVSRTPGRSPRRSLASPRRTRPSTTRSTQAGPGLRAGTHCSREGPGALSRLAAVAATSSPWSGCSRVAPNR